MIKFRRGTTNSWKNTKIKLAPGQPGYDKEKHKIKIGDGEKLWSELPYIGGLSEKEIFDSEESAKTRLKADSTDKTIITYGNTTPDNDTVGQLYLQRSTSDFIVESGISEGWVYQVYNSGVIKCFGNFKITLDITDVLEGTGLYCGNISLKQNYPKKFKNIPTEVVSIQSTAGMTWIANTSVNTKTSMGTYSIISTASINNAECFISIQVEGM